MHKVFIILPFVLAALSSKVLIPLILLIAYKKRLFDPIDSRKLHKRIVPRLGGFAFAPIQVCVLVITLVMAIKVFEMKLDVESWALLPSLSMLLCGLMTLFIVGLGDDLIGINFIWKFLTQIIVACFFPLSGLWINDLYGLASITTLPPSIGMPLTVFVVVLIINAINLIDGLDGLCSGVVGIGCLVLGGLFVYHEAWLHALFAFITLGTLIPFFYYNVFGIRQRRRQIFMGDTGSMTLGYSIAFLAISFSMNNVYIKPPTEGAIVVAFSTLIVPVLDVARVMLVRWRMETPIFKPDCNHLHHKFLRAGMSHRTAMILFLALVLFFCLLNMYLASWLNVSIVLVVDLLVWIGFQWLFNQLEKRKIIAQVQLFINML